MTEDWFDHFYSHLRQGSQRDRSPQEIAQLLHEALEIAQATKYATPASRFIFRFAGATEQELADIRRHLTEFENSIVYLERTE